MNKLRNVSTGLTELDEIIDNLRIGDNVVWRIDDIKEYEYFVESFVKKATEEGKKVVYMRFADHKPLVQPQANVVVYHLNAASGFEYFSSEVHNIISQEGDGIFYVFDSLSDLLLSWSTDLMIGNFFVITCPYLFELDTIAYFAIMRDSHSFQTIARIRDTTQVLIDIYRDEGSLYAHPLKVWQRYSPTMFLPHLREGDHFVPIANSVDAAKLFSHIYQERIERAKRKLDYWDRLFLEAQELLGQPWKTEEQQNMVDRICRTMITRDPRMSIIVRQKFTLEDLLHIRERMIGSGFIGGKTVGMLLARKILSEDTATGWQEILEPHDSFYIGSDVFYTYLVENGLWKLRMAQRTKDGYFEAAIALREEMQKGSFPDEIKEQLLQIVEYYGQSPFIVRSSSLLEDAFGNAFAGKYESVFCVNQGNPAERYAKFEEAVRSIFASAMNEDALMYRLQKGLEKEDEQMALLVQRVSGSYHKHFAFPDVAGVGLSYNAFAWNKDMDPHAGMLRLVFGLGTRAVNRVEGDYTRVVALDAPLIKPHSGMDDTRKYSQREVDVLNIEANEFQTVPLVELMGESLDPAIMKQIAVRDHDTSRKLKELGMKNREAWIITFDNLLSNTAFVAIMQRMLQRLESVYQYPIDIEFTVNFTGDDSFQVNLVQCRPLQTIGREKRVEIPINIDDRKTLFRFVGNFMGGSISQTIRKVIYVEPQQYSHLVMSKKYEVARIIGRLNKMIASMEEDATMLLGPGRWGSTTPSLGIPVRFSEINNISVLGEMAYVDGNLIPELSYGTHFFQDLVETGIFYLAIFPEDEKVFFNIELLNTLPNRLSQVLPDCSEYEDVIKVCHVREKGLEITADVVSQKIVCFC